VSDHRAETVTVNAAGLVQGIALVTFPAASAIFTSPADYDLTSSQYGVMFAPQVVTAIVASLLGAGLLWPGFTARVSEKWTYLAGLLADFAAMVLLVASWGLAHQHPAGYVLLLAATACLGAGFGLAVPSLNTLTAAFHPGAEDKAVLVLNALLGLGTALAPAFVAAFTGIGFWIGLPVLAAVLLGGLIVISLRLPLRPGQAQQRERAVSRLPAVFWLFGAFAFLYGICETMNGNWSQLDLTSLGLRPATASLALTGFWAMVTIGRVLLAVVQRWLPSRVAYHGLPFLLAAAFVLVAALPQHAPGAAVAAFCLAGLGCSALLPLTISFGQEKLADSQTAVAGGVIACYQVGYGVAAFGVGPLVSAGIRVSAIFAASAVIAAVMGGFSLVVARGRPSPASLHPVPARPRAGARALQQGTGLRWLPGKRRWLAGKRRWLPGKRRWLAGCLGGRRLGGASGRVAGDPVEQRRKQDSREQQRQEQQLEPVPQGAVLGVPRPAPAQGVTADHGDDPPGGQDSRDELLVRAQRPGHLGWPDAHAGQRHRACHRCRQQQEVEPVPQLPVRLEAGPPPPPGVTAP
jgi:MFS family permease